MNLQRISDLLEVNGVEARGQSFAAPLPDKCSEDDESGKASGG